MKKAKTLLVICSFLYMTGNGFAFSHHEPFTSGPGTGKQDWKRSSTATWPGMKDGKTYWYKLDKKGGLWWSEDGKKWAAVPDGAWADKEGKWVKIHEKKLVWSTDGSSWAEVPEWKWAGSDGKWYKFDSNWMLWVNGQ